MTEAETSDRKTGTALVGLAVYALCGIGIASAVIAAGSLFNGRDVAGGVWAIAAALSFGLLLNSLFRG